MRRFLLTIPILFSSCQTPLEDITTELADYAKTYTSISDDDPVYLVNTRHTPLSLDSFHRRGCYFYFGKVVGTLMFFNNKTGRDRLVAALPAHIARLQNIATKAEFNALLHTMLPVKDNNHKATGATIQSAFSNKDSAYLQNDFLQRIQEVSNYYGPLAEDNGFVSQSNIGKIDFSLNEYDSKAEFPAPAERLLGLFSYWGFLNYYYVNSKMMDKSADTILYRALPGFLNCRPTEEYHLAIFRLIHELKDTHAMVDYKLYDKFFGQASLNINLEKLGDSFIVKRTRVKSWDDGQLKPGDILLKVNGRPLSERYDSIKQYFSYSNQSIEERIVCRYLLTFRESEFEVELIRDGEKKNLRCKGYNYYKIKANDDQKAPPAAGPITWHPDSIAYCNLRYVDRDNVLDVIETLKKSKGFVLDLRNYINGNFTFFRLCDFLLPKRSQFFKTYYSSTTHPGSLRLDKGYRVGDNDEPHYPHKVVLLVDARTQSMSEFFAMALQTSPNLTTVGTRTAGASGNVCFFTFPGGVKTSYSGIGILYPDGHRLYPGGVKLDTVIPPTYHSLKTQIDNPLAYALFYLSPR